jgi:HlyD family secretion protein
MFSFVKFRFVKLLLLFSLAAVGVTAHWYYYGREEQKTKFLTATADHGDISVTVNATGTIEPEEVIDIGAQVAGMIKEFGRDPNKSDAPIDFGSNVEKGTVLARIDESLYRAAVKQASANLHQAEAAVQQAEANLLAMKSKLEQTRRDWDRFQQLTKTRSVSGSEFDSAKNAYETAAAAVPAGEAAVEAAKKTVESSRAALETAQINLDYCTIVSPVKGVIVDRRVNIGQTVVSSLSAPSLFLLAKDLTRLQIWASVNEADVGQIQPGQPVSFRVAAYPGERFKGKVIQVRLNATMTQNVVTYTVVVGTDNPDGRLLPYMTATLDFEIARRSGVLRVPNAALRWQPTAQQVSPEFRSILQRSDRLRDGTERAKTAEEAGNDAREGHVWVVDGESVRPLKVHLGLSDGIMTEVIGGELRDGPPFVVGESTADPSADSGNPFTPKLPAKK